MVNNSIYWYILIYRTLDYWYSLYASLISSQFGILIKVEVNWFYKIFSNYTNKQNIIFNFYCNQTTEVLNDGQVNTKKVVIKTWSIFFFKP